MNKNTRYNCEQSFEAVDFSKVDTSIENIVLPKQIENDVEYNIENDEQRQFEYDKVKEIATKIAAPKEKTFTQEETLIYNGVFYLYTNLLWMGSRFEELERVASLIKSVADGNSTIFNTLLLAYKFYTPKASIYTESVKDDDTKKIDDRNTKRKAMNTAINKCSKIVISVQGSKVDKVVVTDRNDHPKCLKDNSDLLAFVVYLRGLKRDYWLFDVSDAKIDLVGGTDFEIVRKAISMTVGGFEKMFYKDKIYKELRPLYRYIFNLDKRLDHLKIVDFIFSLLNLPEKDKQNAGNIMFDRDR